MMQLISGALVVLFLSACCVAEPNAKTVTLTGWFADDRCMRGRADKGEFTPNNSECARKCLDEGATAVFIDEKGKALLTVSGYAKVKEDVGYYLEINGVVDPAAKTIRVDSVKRLAEVNPSCGRPIRKK